MLFQDILDDKYNTLHPHFETLYQTILKNQTHDGDLLLVCVNAFYNPEVHTWTNISEKSSPYMFGPNQEGHSEHTHQRFIGNYIKNNIYEGRYSEYLDNIEKANIKETDHLIFEESISIQTEMLIYLKIWESDMFIKKFYQLANLLQGNQYDWYFQIKTANQAGSRSKIIREQIRDNFQENLPLLYDSLKKSYRPQIRNAIAHSQYSIPGKYINLNNYDKNDPYSQIRSISLKEWTEIFHETIAIYTLYNEFISCTNRNYGVIALMNNGIFPIRINRKDPVIEEQYLPLYYREIFEDWGWQPDN